MTFIQLPEQNRLLEVLSYNPETGDLLWVDHPTKAGQEANSISGQVWIDDVQYVTARVIWKMVTGEDPAVLVDHRDVDMYNNRWDNLRLAERWQNNSNTKLRADNVSGMKGVRRYQWDSDRWVSDIRHRGVLYRFGPFDTAEEAQAARRAKGLELHGEFYRD